MFLSEALGFSLINSPRQSKRTHSARGTLLTNVAQRSLITVCSRDLEMNGVRATVVTSSDAQLQHVHPVKLKQIALFQRGVEIEATATMLQKQAAAVDNHHLSQRHFHSEGITKNSTKALL